jgi:hypothetical protein
LLPRGFCEVETRALIACAIQINGQCTVPESCPIDSEDIIPTTIASPSQEPEPEPVPELSEDNLYGVVISLNEARLVCTATMYAFANYGIHKCPFTGATTDTIDVTVLDALW